MRDVSRVVAIGMLAVSALAGPVRAQDEPKGFVCSFETGSAGSYEKGAFKTAAPEPMKFEIADIDLDAQTARLLTEGRAQAGALKIVRAINANSFLEVVNEGFLNLTTVYDKDATSGVHPAVHSRHFGLMGEPVFAQYAGTCVEK